MAHDDAYLLDMLIAARRIRDYLSGKTPEDLEQDVLLQDAVIRRITVLGEAALRISAETRSTIVDIDWRRIIGMRNIIVHQYDRIDLTRVWDAVQQELPKLIATLEALVPPPESP